MSDHCFISYSGADGLHFVSRLADELQGQHPFIRTWLDKRELSASSPEDWDDQIANAIKSCKCLIFVMTVDSTAEGSVCKDEWTWALKYKKPVITLRKDKTAEIPFRLNNHQHVDFSRDFDIGIAQLRTAINRLDSPEGILDQLKRRLAAANRDLRRANDEDKPRIQAEIDELNQQIEAQQKIVDNPTAAQEQTQKNIETGLERERQPEKLVATKATIKFINPPPGIAPTYFQDRFVETKQIVNFLNNDAQRLMTIVGRAGVGKTAMVCRLLKGIESGKLPDGLGEMKMDGIVYLSEAGTHRVNFANIFFDLSKLLPSEIGLKLEKLYKDPQISTGDKMRVLLDSFSQGRVVLLLDNFENLIDAEKLNLRDNELSDALNALLMAPQHAIKVVLTTRVAPRDLAMIESGKQYILSLDEGLASPYAENVLREMDADGHVGFKNASDESLGKAREKTRGYPRALEALYAILSVDRYTSLQELLEINLPKEVVEKLVGEAFNRLDQTAQQVMQALAIYNRPVSPAAIDHLLQAYLPSIDSALVLNRLVNMHFARRESGKYYLHPADREYALSTIPESIKVTQFTQHNLTLRAADYFVQARKPRAEWKKLDDLAAQLAEFDLRSAAGDYDTAADVLTDIDFDYLLLWGHYRFAFTLYEKIYEVIIDKFLRQSIIGNMGSTCYYLGQYQDALRYHGIALKLAEDEGNKANQAVWVNWMGNSFSGLGKVQEAITKYELSLKLAKETGTRKGEGIALGNLGDRYAALGEARKAIAFYEQSLVIAREVGNRTGEGYRLASLGNCYAELGEAHKAIEFYKQALAIAREIGDRRGEDTDLGNLGLAYAALGDARTAIEFYKQALVIDREIGDRRGESIDLENTGHAFLSIEEHQKAKENYQQAIQIADEISFPQVQQNAREGLGENYLTQSDLTNARTIIEAALQYDLPQNNHNATTLHGIIALRQGNESTARQAFTHAIAQADEILAKTPEYYSALDAKGLALCGLAICDDKKYIADAIETFLAARKIAPHAGIVKRNLRLFDELVKCDEERILKDVRKAVEGKE